MKKFFYYFILIICFTHCRRTVTNGPQILFENENQGTGEITLLVSGTGEEDKTLAAGRNSLEDIASRRAFEQLMFIGIPNSTNYRLPLTPNMSRSTNESPFLQTFFESKDYRRFILQITQAGGQERAANYRKSIRFRVSINGDAFRKYLEQNQVIRKFGY